MKKYLNLATDLIASLKPKSHSPAIDTCSQPALAGEQ
jgi:hypothetical protein